MDADRVDLPGSRPVQAPGTRFDEAPPPDERLEVSILLRRPPTPRGGDDAGPSVSASAAAPADLELVRSFLAQAGLDVVEVDPARRTVRAAGTLVQLEQAFGVRLVGYRTGGSVVVTYDGPIRLPRQLIQVVVAVLGLDRRAIARR